MALGAGIISLGLQNGLVQLGTDVVGSKLADLGGATGSVLGAIGVPLVAATYLKSIFIGGVAGVAGVTSLPAVPALALIGGGASILGAFGYAAGDIAERAFAPSLGDFLGGASIVGIGIALMIDGARRVVKDERVLRMASHFKDGVIHFSKVTKEIIATNWDELQEIMKKVATHPDLNEALLIAPLTAAGGAVLTSTYLTSAFTLAGSHSLGALALSLGLVSTPVLPIIAGGAAGLAIGLTVWKGVGRILRKNAGPNTAPH
jgi:hypothetical protein